MEYQQNPTHRTRLFYGLTLLASLFLAMACTPGKKPGYIISGAVESAKDGDVVYLEEINDDEVKVLGKAIIQGGAFKFEGIQDSTMVAYISCSTEKDVFSLPFFLENGNITVKMVEGAESITGTQTNDTYQEVRGKISDIIRQMNEIEQDTNLSDEEREQKMDEAEMEYDATMKEGMVKNITNPVGIFIFKNKYYENSLSENLALLAQIPSEYMVDPQLQGIRMQIAQQEKTDVSKPFTDLIMETPEGKVVKLSDFVGKGKPVLVDFWASWCAPCRQGMPELIRIYDKYKGKFEIVGVAFDEDRGAWQRAITRLELPWPQMSDLKGWKSEAAKEYGIHSIPHTVLIDNNGVIISRDLKGLYLDNKLAEILK